MEDTPNNTFNSHDRPLGMGELIVEGAFRQTVYGGEGDDPADIVTNPAINYQGPTGATGIDASGQSHKIVGEVEKFTNNRLGYRK